MAACRIAPAWLQFRLRGDALRKVQPDGPLCTFWDQKFEPWPLSAFTEAARPMDSFWTVVGSCLLVVEIFLGPS
jgi:hypothetical protein